MHTKNNNLDHPQKVVVIGTGLAGLRTAETLRSSGFEGQLTLVGEEDHLPYERPSLSKEFLAGKKGPDQLTLRPREFFQERQIKLLLGRRVESISVGAKTVFLQGGDELAFDALVLATGARPRHLRGLQVPQGVYHLRTLADALALSREFEAGKHLAVVGAGFIGAEVASTAISLGLDVTMVEPLGAPLIRVLGPEVGSILARRYRDYGVDLRLDIGVTDFVTNGRLRGLKLSGGEELTCNAAVIGIGAEPSGELLGGGAIKTDASGRTEYPGIYAAGDVTLAWRPSLDRYLHIEHWTNASGQAMAVARTILGEEASHDDVPFFWSDQFGYRLQYVGYAEKWDRVEIEGSDDSFSARYLDSSGQLLAALGANCPVGIKDARQRLNQQMTKSIGESR